MSLLLLCVIWSHISSKFSFPKYEWNFKIPQNLYFMIKNIMIEDKQEHMTVHCHDNEKNLQKYIFNDSAIIAQLPGYYRRCKAQDIILSLVSSRGLSMKIRTNYIKNGMLWERNVPLESSSDTPLREEEEKKKPQFFHHVNREMLGILSFHMFFLQNVSIWPSNS